MNEEIASLPKWAPQTVISTNGALQKYQDRLVEKYFVVIGELRKATNQISLECQNKLHQRMESFKNIEKSIKQEQKTILDSLGTTKATFSELENNLATLEDQLLIEAQNLRKESVEIYENHFSEIKPIVESSFNQCSMMIPQIPIQFADNLHKEVRSLNENYLKTKLQLVKSFYTIETSIIESNSSVKNEFEQRSDEWKVNRFALLVSDAKTKLDPYYPMNLSPIFEEFHSEQNKFTMCIKKLIQSVSLIAPPDHFQQEDLNKWWSEVEEILNLHGLFIQKYLTRLQRLVEERDRENSGLLSSLEAELVELRDESEASDAISELSPILKQSQKYGSTMVDKVTKYWEMQKENLKKSLESIKQFLAPIIDQYGIYIKNMKGIESKKDSSKSSIQQKCSETLLKLETELQGKTEQIPLLIDQTKINSMVNECKQILTKIEGEYRDYYNQALSYIDEQPATITHLFESFENDLLNKLKVKKTASSQEWADEKPPTSSQATKRNKTASRAPRRQSKGRPESKVNVLGGFNLGLENGAKYEESEALSIIPPFDDFIEEHPQTIQTGKQKNKSQLSKVKKPPPPKGKKITKGKNDDNEDIEGPEFMISESVPRINEQIAIWIFSPRAIDLNEWVNSFRRIIILEFSSVYSREMRRANSHEEKQLLAEELNDRMRTHAPRAKSIELNIAKTRSLQIESRKIQIEKHIRHSISHFNQGVTGLEASILKRKLTLVAECEKLREFSKELVNQKSTSSFSVLGQNLHISEKFLLTHIEQHKLDHEKELKAFIDFTSASNERFIQTVILADNTYSQEERDMSNEYFSKMKIQIENIMSQLRDKAKATFTEVEEKHANVMEEYEQSLPNHKADVAFIESIALSQNEAKSKFETLLARNKIRSSEVEHSIKTIIENQNEEGDPQTVLLHQLELFDSLRVLLINRSTYLGLMKSELSSEPLTFLVNLSSETAPFDPKLSDTLSSTDKKKGRPKSKQKPDSRTKSSNAKDNTQSKKPNEISTELNISIQSQIEQIGNELINNVSRIATDYYNSFKTRKVPISRPNLIPPTQAELIEQSNSFWQKIIASSGSIIEDSCLKLRSQIINTVNIARDTSRIVYGLFSRYYLDLVNSQRSAIQQNFDASYRETTEARQKNKMQLNPRLADKNNETLFNALLESEVTRSAQEAQIILSYQNEIVECEKHVMQLFCSQITSITSSLLSLFDRTAIIEDLKNGKIEGAERKTMKELLKEKKRQELGGSEDGRPVRIRQWPGLPLIMEPMVLNNTEASNVQMSSSRSASRKKKKKNERGTAPSESSTNNADNTPQLSSFETVLHRSAIVERNKCYDDYEQLLKKRIDDFRQYTKSLIDDTNGFKTHWKQCVFSLKPELLVFETEK